MDYVEILTLASKVRMLPLNFDTCQSQEGWVQVYKHRGTPSSSIFSSSYSLPQNRSFHLDEVQFIHFSS